ncbi:MAG: hypothetical protein IJ343_06745, partial [Clostridia bacterium]|nr:hypothetical protein [Clostridia bacterium]
PLDDETITLEIYSQLANYNGLQTGWSAALLKDLFNVEVVIIPDQDGTYETRMASGNLGDIVVWGSNGEDYKQAVKKDMLLNWDEPAWGSDMPIVEQYAPYVAANYGDALKTNRAVSDNDDQLYGFGFGVALQEGAHASFMYSWDLRWDLYSQLGYPEIKNLDDLVMVLKQMKEICPKDELGNETYGASLWPDWDGNMVMYVKALATAYYGYDELGFGLYNPTNGEFYDALMDNGPYIEMLRFFNKLYREDLLDPNSMTQTYDEMGTKVKNGGVFWGIFNYASSMTFNTTAHLEAGKMMYSRVPDEANPIVYGLSSLGGNRIWSIGNYTAYPELCMAILDFLATPEGSMTMWYGPRGLTWDYNEDGGMYFTELGMLTNADSKYDMNGIVWTSPYTGKQYTLSGTYNDGALQINNTTLNQDMINPDGKLGEAFNKNTWVSVQTAVSYPIQQDWRDWSGVSLVDQYFENIGKYTVMPDLPYSEASKSDDLKVKWDQCAKAITTNSWRAIYAKNDGEFNFHIMNMKNQCKGYGWQQCLDWSLQEAATKWQLQQEQEAMKAQ